MAKDLSRVQQIIIVMMENRSFDHLIGYLSLPEFGHPNSHDIVGIAQAREFYTSEFSIPTLAAMRFGISRRISSWIRSTISSS